MKKALFILLISALSLPISAQRVQEFGLFLGASYYNGDLNPSLPFVYSAPAGGLVYRYNYNPHFALKLNGSYGYKVMGDDALNPETEYESRNLSFFTDIFEVGANFEINFFKFIPGSQTHRWTPYVFAGVSVFHFNPKADFNGEIYELQPLGTEGQNTTDYPDLKPYALTQMALPFGLGFKFNITSNFNIALEWGMRKTFTDYLDDVGGQYADPATLSSQNTPIAMVLGNRAFEAAGTGDWGGRPYPNYPIEMATAMMDSQRANVSGNTDWYSFYGLTFTFKLKGPKSQLCPAYQNHYKFKEYYLF